MVVRAAGLIVALLLSACSKPSYLCREPISAPAEIGVTLADNVKQADACIQRWSRIGAVTKDALPDVANAVVGACRGAIDEMARMYAVEQTRVKKLPSPLKPDYDGWRDDMRRQATTLILQARAGDCPTP